MPIIRSCDVLASPKETKNPASHPQIRDNQKYSPKETKNPASYPQIRDNHKYSVDTDLRDKRHSGARLFITVLGSNRPGRMFIVMQALLVRYFVVSNLMQFTLCL